MKPKFIFITLLIFSSFAALSQRSIQPTDSLLLFGKVQTPVMYTLAQLDTFTQVPVNDQIIFNHKGEVKDTITDIKGIPLKNVLSKIKYLYDKPKELNEFYFVFSASDGYKVVFSWNEIYNTETGNQFYIITGLEGKNLSQMTNRIVFLSAGDLKSGRRYIKGLQSIEIKRLE